MSIEHDDIYDTLSACASAATTTGHAAFVRATQRNGKTIEGSIPPDYCGRIVRSDNQQSTEMPESKMRYALIEVVDSDGVLLQKLAPARSASTERGLLAAMLEAAREERKLQAAQGEQQRLALLKDQQDAAAAAASMAATANQQRLILLQEQQAATAQAKAAADAAEHQRQQLLAEHQRAMMEAKSDAAKAAAERTAMFNAIQALTAQVASQSSLSNTSASSMTAMTPTQVLFGSSAAHPHIVGSATTATTGTTTASSASVTMLPPELISMMKRREEEESKIFSSHTHLRGDIFTDDQALVLKTLLPEYRWMKSDAKAHDMRMGLRAMADSILEYGQMSHMIHAQHVISSLVAAGRSATPTDAAELQMALGVAASANGTIDWPRVTIAELAVHAARNVATGTMARLKAARCTLPDAPSCATGALANLPIRQAIEPPRRLADEPNKDKNRNKDKDKDKAAKEAEIPRTCRTCGKLFKGKWSKEACAAGHF